MSTQQSTYRRLPQPASPGRPPIPVVEGLGLEVPGRLSHQAAGACPISQWHIPIVLHDCWTTSNSKLNLGYQMNLSLVGCAIPPPSPDPNFCLGFFVSSIRAFCSQFGLYICLTLKQSWPSKSLGFENTSPSRLVPPFSIDDQSAQSSPYTTTRRPERLFNSFGSGIG